MRKIKSTVAGFRLVAMSLSLAAIAALALTAAAPSARALVLGAGQTATVDFNFGTIAPGNAPVTFTFEILTATPSELSDSAGTFTFEYLGIGAPGVSSFGYDGSGGGYNPGPLAIVISTTDLIGSLRLGVLTESWDLSGVLLSIADNFGAPIAESVSLDLPEAPDVQIPEPGPLATIAFGLIALAGTRRLRRR